MNFYPYEIIKKYSLGQGELGTTKFKEKNVHQLALKLNDLTKFTSTKRIGDPLVCEITYKA